MHYLQATAGTGWRSKSKEVGRSTLFAEGGLQAMSAAHVGSHLSNVSESQVSSKSTLFLLTIISSIHLLCINSDVSILHGRGVLVLTNQALILIILSEIEVI